MRFHALPIFVSLLVLPLVSCQFVSINECSGWSDEKQICAQATLFLDGTLAGEVTTESDNLFHGCRGGAVAIGSDAAGRALWTAMLPGKTACGVTDVFCASFRRNAVTAHVDAHAAGRTKRIHLFFNFDEKSFHEKFHHLTSRIGSLVEDINGLRGGHGEL